MASKDPTVFESAMRGMRIVKQGRVVQIVADGNGACATIDVDYNTAYKWAASKSSSGSSGNDRTRFLDQIPNLVARPGSFINTRGNDKPIEDIARLMVSAGFDLNDWALPPTVKVLFMKGPKPQAKKPATDAADSTASDPPVSEQ